MNREKFGIWGIIVSSFAIPGDISASEGDEGFRRAHDFDEAVVKFELHGEVLVVSGDAGAGGEVEEVISAGDFEVNDSE